MKTVVVATSGTTGWPEFAGSTWVRMQYVLGLQRLGIESFWIEKLGPVNPWRRVHTLEYLMHRFDQTARDFGFASNYCVVYDGGKQTFGLSESQLVDVLRRADLVISVGKTVTDLGSASVTRALLEVPRRAYVDVDPGFTQIWARQVDMAFDTHNFFFTVGQNVDSPDFRVPSDGIEWLPIVPPVVLDLWPPTVDERYERFSTVGDWRGSQSADFEGERYGGKREEFLRFLKAPVEAKQ